MKLYNYQKTDFERNVAPFFSHNNDKKSKRAKFTITRKTYKSYIGLETGPAVIIHFLSLLIFIYYTDLMFAICNYININLLLVKFLVRMTCNTYIYIVSNL